MRHVRNHDNQHLPLFQHACGSCRNKKVLKHLFRISSVVFKRMLEWITRTYYYKPIRHHPSCTNHKSHKSRLARPDARQLKISVQRTSQTLHLKRQPSSALELWQSSTILHLILHTLWLHYDAFLKVRLLALITFPKPPLHRLRWAFIRIPRFHCTFFPSFVANISRRKLYDGTTPLLYNVWIYTSTLPV